jgi:hypothetical protein
MSRVRMFAWSGGMVALAWACTPARSHLFIADLYESAMGCLDPGTAVDVADGPPNDLTCDAACAIQPQEGGIYVTSQCPPYPLGWDMSGTDPSCPAALMAHGRGDFCVDGGSTNPLDAAGDGAAASDSSTSSDAIAE